MKAMRKYLVALATSLTITAQLLPGGITAQEAITIILAALGALGVYAVRNEVPS